jgi:phosphoenolpyruvate carboxykinase (GTP)
MRDKVDLKKIFAIEKDFWIQEIKEIEQYFDDQVGDELPARIRSELEQLKKRIEMMD